MIERSDKFRKHSGCRAVDKLALAADPIMILGQPNFLPYCPGIIVDTPYTYSVYELERFVRAGLSLGNALEMPYPMADSLAMLCHARDLERGFRAKEENGNNR